MTKVRLGYLQHRSKLLAGVVQRRSGELHSWRSHVCPVAGVVVMMLDTKMEPPVARDMVKGAPDQLRSAFHLNYSSLLNMLRCEGVEPEALMKASFAQFQMERSLPQLQARVTQLEVSLSPLFESDKGRGGRELADACSAVARVSGPMGLWRGPVHA